MAVYKRTYKSYSGPRTVPWLRFLVLTRYSCARLFQSKFLVLFISASLFYPLGCLVFIYLSNNGPLQALLDMDNAKLPAIDGEFFYRFCRVQGAMAYLLTALAGPGLVSPDLANGALPLYFSRPFSRTEYVGGKMTLLLFLLSLITWIPGMVLYCTQACLAGWEWTAANLWLGGAILLAMIIWIILLSLIGLALSAWVKSKIVAGALVLAVFFAGSGFGSAVNTVLRTHYGGLISLTQVIATIWGSLFRYDWGAELSVSQAWIVLGLACAVCGWMLARRIRPVEVIK
jgi:ABC-2 type transport system permease protein